MFLRLQPVVTFAFSRGYNVMFTDVSEQCRWTCTGIHGVKSRNVVFWIICIMFTVIVLVEKFPVLYATPKSIAMMTRVHYWSVSWARWIRTTSSHTIYLISTLVLSSYVHRIHRGCLYRSHCLCKAEASRSAIIFPAHDAVCILAWSRMSRRYDRTHGRASRYVSPPPHTHIHRHTHVQIHETKQEARSKSTNGTNEFTGSVPNLYRKKPASAAARRANIPYFSKSEHLSTVRNSGNFRLPLPWQ
jgi:hypothetical protein